MPQFDPLIEAQLAGTTVRASPLVKFGFVSGDVFLWQGFGDLSIGGNTYRGIGNLGSLSAITTSVAGAVEEMTFTLAGEEGLLAHLAEDEAESLGRAATTSLQFFDVRKFDDAGNFVEWMPIDEPYVLFEGAMGPLSVKRQPPAAERPATRTISVSAQNYLISRGRTPPRAYWSDRAQRAVYPIDNLFSRMSDYAFSSTKWPQF
jgi:hypothetical protein